MSFQNKNSIVEFRGDYSFLSNFYPHSIEYMGILYPSSEHAYVSAKSNNVDFKIKISKIKSPSEVKRLGRETDLVENWNNIKLSIMEEIVRIKFSDEVMKSQLLATNGKDLYEGNWWHDNFYGYCICDKCGDKIKNNHLGNILMKIRNESKYTSII